MLDILKNKDISVLGGGSISLLVESYSNAEQVVQIRGLTEDSRIIFDHTTNSDRSLATSVFAVTGIPISIAVRTAGTGVKRGACFVKVSLRVDGVVVALLICGYVTDAGNLAWPNGKIENSIEGPGLMRSITGTNPAAGVEISETVPTGARWRLKSLTAILVPDATVGTRYPILTITDGTNFFIEISANAGQIASQAQRHNVHSFGTHNTNSYAGLFLPISENIIMLAGWKILFRTGGIQAGDGWGAPQYCVEEWIEP